MMDKKLIVIFAPILGAGTWAVFTISRQLLQQVKSMRPNRDINVKDQKRGLKK